MKKDTAAQIKKARVALKGWTPTQLLLGSIISAGRAGLTSGEERDQHVIEAAAMLIEWIERD